MTHTTYHSLVVKVALHPIYHVRKDVGIHPQTQYDILGSLHAQFYELRHQLEVHIWLWRIYSNQLSSISNHTVHHHTIVGSGNIRQDKQSILTTVNPHIRRRRKLGILLELLFFAANFTSHLSSLTWVSTFVDFFLEIEYLLYYHNDGSMRTYIPRAVTQ